MCFSATASFTAASVLATAGLFTLSRARSVRELPLAGVPVLFAAQQAIEGALWLTLPHPESAVLSGWLANAFALIALVIWPVYAPLAVLLVRRGCGGLRCGSASGWARSFALYSAHDMMLHPYHVVRAPASLCYINNSPYPLYALAIYLPAVCGAFLVASDRLIRLFGLAILGGLAVSLAAFYADVVSVWCFFASLASLIFGGTLLRRPISDAAGLAPATHQISL